MSFEPPAGILDIGNATLRVGKLEVAETSGLNQGLLNIVKNNILINENIEYPSSNTWGIKLPTTWVAEFDVKGHSTTKYVEFNFYNEDKTSNALGYLLNFKDTTLSLMYDTSLSQDQNILATATIPTIVGAFRKVNIFFERGVISVSIDGTRYLYHKETDGFNQGLGVASRVVSTTGSAFVNLFIEQNAGDSAFKNLRIVNGRFISDKTSNIAFIGGNLGVGVNSPQETLDIRGNMHFNRVSNVSQIKVDSNVVTEYTGPHDRPLRKYPEVAMTANDNSSTSGYVASISSGSTTYDAWKCFNGTIGGDDWDNWLSDGNYDTSDGDAIESGANEAATTTVSGTTVRGEWVQLKLPKQICLKDLALAPMMYGGTQYATGRTPTKGVIVGSIDGTNWELVHSFTAAGLQSFPQNYYASSIGAFNSSKYYDYFRLIIEEVTGGTNGNRVALGEVCFYGHEEGSGSLDTTLKTVYNVPATTGTQLDVYYDAKETSSYSGSGTTVNDLAGTQQNGTFNGGFDSTYKAFTFNGTSQNMTTTLANSGTPSAYAHTFAFWTKPISNLANHIQQAFLQLGTHSANSCSALRLEESTGLFRWFFHSNDIVYSADHIKIGEWNHIVAAYDGGSELTSRRIWVNDKEIHHTTTSGTIGALSLSANALLAIGSQDGGSNWNNGLNGSIANFRLFSKALNADQVRELYDYQKDYFLGSKSQVTLYKGHLGVGVTEPSGQLELAGDERIQEYPPRAFDGGASQQIGPNEVYIEGHGHFKAWSTGNYGGDYEAGGAFTKTSGVGTVNFDRWVSPDNIWTAGTSASSPGTGLPNTGAPTFAGYKGAHLILELPYAINLKSFTIGASGETQSNYDTHVAQTPSVFVIIASNDGNNWDTIFSHTATDGVATDYIDTVFSVNVTKAYSQYGYVALKNGNTNGFFHVTVGEWRLFGTPGPTTLDKGSLSLGRSLDVPRVSRYDADTETPRPEKLVVDFDTTVNSSPTDISGQGNHGTLIGATYSAPDKAFDFSATNNVIYAPSLSPTMTGDIIVSMSCWFKLDNSATRQTIMWIGSDASDADFIDIRVKGGHIGLSMGYDPDTNMLGIKTGSILESNRWYHVVGVKSGTGAINSTTTNTMLQLYLDGVKLNTVDGGRTETAGLNIPTDHNFLVVGAGNETGSVLPMAGQVSNPKIYNVALEPSEVQKLYRLGRTGRSMVISDTAVGIGKIPEAQLDVRGVAQFGSIYAPGTIIQVRTNSDTNTSTGYTTLNYATTVAAGSGNIPIARATGLKASITPRSKKSRIYADFHVLVYFPSMTNITGARIQCWRKIGSTYERIYGAPGGHDLHHYDNHTGSLHTYTRVSFVDNSPNTLQECEYELRAMLYGAANAGSLQLGNGGNQPANCILMEIGGE